MKTSYPKCLNLILYFKAKSHFPSDVGFGNVSMQNLSFCSSLFGLCSSHTSTQVCKDTHPRQTPGRKHPLRSMQGDGGKGSYISHLDFLRIQTWMAWPVRKAPVLMRRTHVLPQVVMHLFSLFPLEQKKSIRNPSHTGLCAPRDEREGKSSTCECSNGICRKLQTTRNKAFNT